MPATRQIYELIKRPNLFYLKGGWVLVIKKDTLFRWRGHVRSISKWRESSHPSLNLEDGVHFRYTILSLKQRGRLDRPLAWTLSIIFHFTRLFASRNRPFIQMERHGQARNEEKAVTSRWMVKMGLIQVHNLELKTMWRPCELSCMNVVDHFSLYETFCATKTENKGTRKRNSITLP